ncbi:serine/arginine repetitive matrix protein 2-like [Sycon ciliatum]|uniref:serine/arginine repetitive matrix protein 2-like n=1 Tax=Sycon ciliatum TaxID=27933 RepID=UPI0031F6F2B7
MGPNGLPSRGMRLEAFVEETLDDLLVVSVTVAGRKLQGILFDTEKRSGQAAGNDSALVNGVDRQSLSSSSSVPRHTATSSVAQSTQQTSTVHEDRLSSAHPVATLGDRKTSLAEPGVKRKSTSSPSSKQSPARKRLFANDGATSQSATVDASSTQKSPSSRHTVVLSSCGEETDGDDFGSTSEETAGSRPQHHAVSSKRPRLRGMARRGRVSLLAVQRHQQPGDSLLEREAAASSSNVKAAAKTGCVRLRGAGRGRPPLSGRGQQRKGAASNSATLRLLSSDSSDSAAGSTPTKTTSSRGGGRVRLRGGRGRGAAAAARLSRQHVSRGASLAAATSKAGSRPPVSDEESSTALFSVPARQANTAPAVRGGVRLRGRGGMRRPPTRGSLSSSSRTGTAMEVNDEDEDFATVTISPSTITNIGVKTSTSEHEHATASASKKSHLLSIDLAGANGMSRLRDAERDVKRRSDQSSPTTADANSRCTTPTTCQSDDDDEQQQQQSARLVCKNSPLSRSAAASLVASHSPKQRTPMASTSSPASDLEMPLSPVLSFHKSAFRIGDVVWAKMVDAPWWPAVVESIRSSNTASAAMQDLSLLFLGRKGSTQTSLLPTTLVAPFVAGFKAKFLPKKRTSTYVRAVQEACERCNVDPPPVPQAPSKPALSHAAAGSSSETKSGREDSISSDQTADSYLLSPVKIVATSSEPDIGLSALGTATATATATAAAASTATGTAESTVGVTCNTVASEQGVVKVESLESVTSLQTHPPASPYHYSSANDSS